MPVQYSLDRVEVGHFRWKVSYTCKVSGFNSVMRVLFSTGTVHLYVRKLLIYTEGRAFLFFFLTLSHFLHFSYLAWEGVGGII